MKSDETGKTAIQYTETARFSIQQAARFLKSKGVDPRAILSDVIAEFENRVISFPQSCAISQQLSEIGCHAYRECNTTNGYRILYSYDESDNRITVHAIIHQKQDIQGLLFQTIISWSGD